MSPEIGLVPTAKTLAALPAGAVTFLFTDIEGSTQRWEAHHDAMRVAVGRHDALIRTTIDAHGGYIFKAMGDAFCAAFTRAGDALRAALDAQRLLNAEEFRDIAGMRVRMGLHAGVADERDGDYFGPTVNRVARLMSIGHGGQVLLSSAVREMVADNLPDGVSLVDLGLRRLKDLVQPEQVWQLNAAGLMADFPPLNSLDLQPNNLPEQLTALIGREGDLADVNALVGKHRVVTLFGSGGVGKTRVALQIGGDLIERFADGVWFADLAPIRDPELVSSVVGKALNISAPEGRRLDEVIPQALRGKKMLLIIDNCEQVIEAAASLAHDILSAAPDVKVLATSRQALGISGEVVYRLPSLAVPASTSIGADEALGYGALSLFVDRVKAGDTRFALTDETAPIVVDICRRLDGIPLAIELAAARVKVLSIPNLAQRLKERFKLLTGGSRTALPRQKTLAALIDWSYDLLSGHEQSFFNSLGIFAGGFSWEAATAVCGVNDIGPIEVLDLLSSLTDKSLIVAETGGQQERYRLLESTRAYALDKLASSDLTEQLARRHAEFFCHEAQAADSSYGVESISTWLTRVEVELDNYRSVLEWALTDGNDVTKGGAVAGALERFWANAGLAVEGRYWIGRAQGGLDESAHPSVACRLWLASCWLSDAQHKRDAAERALALCGRAGAGYNVGWALMYLGDSFIQMGRLKEASETHTRALEAMRASGNQRGVVQCLNQLSFTLCSCGDVAAGRKMFAEAIEACKALGDDAETAMVLRNLAEWEFADNHPEQALSLAGEALELRTRGKNDKHLAIDYNNSAAYRIALGDFEGASQAVHHGLRAARQAEFALGIATASQHSALIGALRQQTHVAARLLGYVDVRYKQIGYEREFTEKWSYEKLVAALRANLSEAEIKALGADGAAWSEDRAIKEAQQVT